MSTPTAGSPAAPDPATTIAATDQQTSGGCAHCDGSVPHRHLDVAAAVREADARVAARGRRDRTVGIVVLLVATVVSYLLLPTTLDAMFALLAGLGGWGLAMLLGLLVLAAYGRRRPGSVQYAADGTPLGAPRGAAVAAGVVVAVLVPFTGLLAGVVGGTPWAALSAAGTWLAMAGLTQGSSARSMRTLLTSEGAQGEAARQSAVHGELVQGPGLGWLWHGTGVAVWGVLASFLPVTLLVTVPLHVAATLLLARRGLARER